MTLRRSSLAPIALSLTVLGPIAYFLLNYNPFARATGAPMWGLMGAGALVACIALSRDRSRRAIILSSLSLGITLLAVAVFFWLLDVPEATEARRLQKAPDFTLTDHHGQRITLSEHCRQGPTLLLFYRGHWWLSCRSEFRGLGNLQAELSKRGGSILAVSVDSNQTSKAFAQSQGIQLPLLADEGARVIREYGLLHQGGGYEAPDVAIPAQFLLSRDRRILWRHVASRVPDRADPEDVLQVVRQRWPQKR